MQTSNDVLQHFQPEELSFVDKVYDLLDRVERTYALVVTDFLNPRELLIVQSLSRRQGISCYLSTNIYDTEYGQAILAPDYYVYDTNDFNFSLIEITYNTKFNTLTHSQILGTLLHHLGIKRSLIGDILLDEGVAQVFVDKSIVSLITTDIIKIGKAGVKIREVPLTHKLVATREVTEQLLQLSSLRLDKVISSAYKLSRQQAAALIESERVKVNYRLCVKMHRTLAIGDMISVRKFGRIKLVEDQGLTKSGKHKVVIEKTKH